MGWGDEAGGEESLMKIRRGFQAALLLATCSFLPAVERLEFRIQATILASPIDGQNVVFTFSIKNDSNTRSEVGGGCYPSRPPTAVCG